MVAYIQRWFPSFDGRQKQELEQFFNDVFPDLNLGDTDTDYVGDLTGDVTGNVTGNVAGNVTGDVKAVDGALIVDSAADIANSVVQAGSLIGALTGSASKLVTGTPVNAVAAVGTITLAANACLHGDALVIGSTTYDLWGDFVNAYAGGNTEVDITSGLTQSTATLTIDDVVLDGETIEVESDTYEFMAEEGGSVGGGNIEVDITETTVASTVRSEGELTLVNGDLGGDTIVVAGTTTTLKSDGTAGSASVIDLTVGETFPATLQRGTATITFAGVPADGENVVVNARTYQFDPSADGGGDVQILTAGDTTVEEIRDQFIVDYNADGSRVALATPVSTNAVLLTAIEAGVVGNYTVTETLADGGISGNMTGGANATALEVGALVLAHFASGGAGEEATVLAVAGATADKVIFRAVVGGTAGDAITTTHTLTAGSFDAINLGTKEAGVDCTKADAQSAFMTAVAANASAIYTFAAFGGDASVLTINIGGTAGDGETTVFTTAGSGAFDVAVTAGGADITDANLDGLIIAADVGVAEVMAQGGGTTITVTAQTAGVAANAVIFTETLTGGTMTGTGTLGGTGATVVGVDGTVGAQWDVLIDAGYLYIAVAANTVADQNWERAAIASF